MGSWSTSSSRSWMGSMAEFITDENLRFIILGAFRGSVSHENFPILVDHVEENYDEDDQVESFTIVTQSGLRFTTTVTFEEAP